MTSIFSTDELNKILRQNYFEVFDLPPQYKIDHDKLNSIYQRLQKQLHPDNFIDHPDNLLSVMVSAHINNAYNTLNSTLLKTIELLRQNGVILDLNINKELPAKFLMQQMELYEEIEESSGNTEKLETLAHKLTNKINKFSDKIEQNFIINDFTAIINDAKKLAFYNKLSLLVDQKIEESW